MTDVANHDCGHTCCPIRNDRFHDHFLTPEQCGACQANVTEGPPTPGYPGQPPAEQAWVKHASEAIVEALQDGATDVVFDVPTHQGNIVFDEDAYLREAAAHASTRQQLADTNQTAGAYIKQLEAELAEFKQWAEDACELLHRLPDAGNSGEDDMAITDLLRRMENP